MRIDPTNICLAVMLSLGCASASLAEDGRDPGAVEAPRDETVNDGKASLKSEHPVEPAKSKKKDALPGDFEDLPTFIKSDSLSLKSADRVFVYTGNVEVRQGDMTLTSDALEGYYDEDNKIERLVALKNVVITKGDEIKATGQKGVYEASTETVTLTEGPELQQNESVLTADLIRIFLKEDRSTAEGDVRVKLVNKSGGKSGQDGVLGIKR